MKLALVFLFALSVLPVAPVSADASLEDRIQSLSKRIAKQPEDQVLRLRRAALFMDDGERELALADILAAESLGDPVAAAPTHGVLLYRERDYAAAQRYFDLYLQKYPADWGVLKYRASLLRDMGNNTQALADYEALLRLSDELDPGYYVVTARLMASVPQRGVDEALVMLDKRMAQRGNISTLQRCAIELEVQRGNYTAAIARLSQLDERLRATPQWQLDVADVLLQADRAEEALPYLAVAQEQLEGGRLTVIHQQLLDKAQRLQVRARDATTPAH